MPAASRARNVCEFGLDLCALLFLPILVLASRGAAALLVVAGICALGLAVQSGAVGWRRVAGLAVLLGLLVAWGVASALWAIEPWRSLITALRLSGMFAGGLALIVAADEIAAPSRLLSWLAVGLAMALVLALVQFATGGALTAPLHQRPFIAPALNNAEDGFGFLILPLCAALAARGQCALAVTLGIATVAVIFLLVGDTARDGFVLGGIAAGLIWAWRKPVTRAAAAISVVVILTAPVAFPALGKIDAVQSVARHAKSSLVHRLEIWSFVGDRIGEKPWLGWGLDSSRVIPGGDQPVPHGAPGQQLLPLHPHNGPLQVRLELGVPGALLFAVFAARLWLALGAARWPPLYTAAVGGSLVTAFVVALASYGIWQEWLISSEFLTLFLILVMQRAAVQPRPETRSGSIS